MENDQLLLLHLLLLNLIVSHRRLKRLQLLAFILLDKVGYLSFLFLRRIVGHLPVRGVVLLELRLNPIQLVLGVFLRKTSQLGQHMDLAVIPVIDLHLDGRDLSKLSVHFDLATVHRHYFDVEILETLKLLVFELHFDHFSNFELRKAYLLIKGVVSWLFLGFTEKDLDIRVAIDVLDGEADWELQSQVLGLFVACLDVLDGHFAQYRDFVKHINILFNVVFKHDVGVHLRGYKSGNFVVEDLDIFVGLLKLFSHSVGGIWLEFKLICKQVLSWSCAWRDITQVVEKL